MASVQLLHTQARIFFHRLSEVLDEQCGEDGDIDSDGRHLELTTPSGQIFLLNFHEPSQQIWLSSPISGAHHCALVNGQWLSVRDQKPLLSLLSAELTQALGRTVVLI